MYMEIDYASTDEEEEFIQLLLCKMYTLEQHN